MGKRVGREALSRLRGKSLILPSLLQCDFGNLEREIRRLEAAGTAALHLDVMDGHFVPNLTYGMPIVSSIRRLTELPLDVHLMISNPQEYVGKFIDAGADLVTVHAEVPEQLEVTLGAIRSAGAGAGVAINPDTDVKVLEALLPLCDLVLIMSVNAGFGGQAFNPVALDKLRWLRQRVSPDVLLEVDGGVNLSTIRDCSQAGASLFVVGSAIFGQADYGTAIADLSRQLRS
jgi:ribulose-phosphate 3-epimerase